MQVTETLSDGLKRGYAVAIPAADLEARRAARLTGLGATLNLPGFRPGKVPANVVRQRYGAAVESEVREKAIESATDELLRDRGLRPAQQPQVSILDEQPGEPSGHDLRFNVEFEVLPDIEIPDFSTIALVRPKAEPGAEAVDRTLSEIAGRQREFTDVTEPRPAANGDMLVVDFVGKIDDVAFDGGTANDVQMEVGGGGFIPGFTEQVEGMNVGETRAIDVTFPADYQASELAGKSAVFDITAKGLRQPAPMEIDDAFAAKLGFETLDKLREVIVEQMQREYDNLSRMRVKRQLLDALAERARFQAPASMVEGEFGGIWRRVEADMKAGKLDDDDKAKDEETLRGEYRAIAERRVRLGLLLAEIGRVNAIQVSPDEMSRAMRAEAARYQGQEQQVLAFFAKNPQAAETLRGPLLEEKVVDHILDLAAISDQTVTPEELVAEPEAAAA